MGHFPPNVAATLVAKRGRMVGAPVDNTDYKMPDEGEGVDRQGYQSALVLVAAALNISAISGDNTSTITVQVEHSETTTDGDFENFGSAVVRSVVAEATGIAHTLMAIPLDLTGAKRYLRAKAKVTSGANTFTTTIPHSLGAAFVLGGGPVKPDAAYDTPAYHDENLADIAE